jgi:pimeloyl-ACP methyl ester carboxylesterase
LSIGSGVGFLWNEGEFINRIIGEGFHLLSFDPRGVKGSIPQANCFVDSAQRAEFMKDIPWNTKFEAGKMYTRADNTGKACVDTLDGYGAYINTPQTAADMNLILDAIGQENMYYWGFSCKIFIFSINSCNSFFIIQMALL